MSDRNISAAGPSSPDSEKVGLLLDEKGNKSSSSSSSSENHLQDIEIDAVESYDIGEKESTTKIPSPSSPPSSSFLSHLMQRLQLRLPASSRSPSTSDLTNAMLTTLRSTPWRALLIRFLVFLVPSFLQGPQAREHIRPAKLSPTAYLDGMRGLAALFVFFCHYSYQAFRIAYSWGSGDDNWHPLKLPLIRLFYQGPMAVCVFFVISGYALSYRAMKLVRDRSWVEFSGTVSSLVFRRGIRLYLPTAISTLMVICLLRIGAYEWTRDFAGDKTYIKNIVEPHPERLESAIAQFEDWIANMFNFVHVYGWERFGGNTNYDVHLWTIPVEFRCSLYLFLAIVGTARLQTWIRYVVIILATLFTWRNSRWDMYLFFCGMMIAETDHIRGAHRRAPPPPPPRPSSPISNSDDDHFDDNDSNDPILPISQSEKPKPPTRKIKPWPIFWALLSILALYLMSFPDDGGNITPGYVWLTAAIPPWWTANHFRHWQSIGAVLFVTSVGHSPRWQRFFNTGPVQYFGKISYALYLMHGPVMHTIGYHWEKLAYTITGVEGYWYNAGFFLGSLFCVPTVIWCADIFWRAVDIPTVKFAKWLEGKCLAKF